MALACCFHFGYGMVDLIPASRIGEKSSCIRPIFGSERGKLAGLRAMAFEFNAENRISRATYAGLTLAGRNFGVGTVFLNISDVVGRNDQGELTRNIRTEPL